jgi:hypothetical protein
VWHFSHYHVENCQAGYESALHLAVKAVFEQDRQLALPPCFVVRHETAREGNQSRVDKNATWSGVYEYLTDRNALVYERDLASVRIRGIAEISGRMMRFDRVEVEVADGNIRPDLVGYAGGRRINLEVAVTHFIEKVKLGRIRERGVPTLEIIIPPGIDPDWEVLRKLLHRPDDKYWRFNPLAEQKAEADYRCRLAADEKRRQREALLLQRAAEIKQRKAVIRETTFQPVAEVRLKRGSDNFYVRWNKANVNLSVYPYTESGAKDAARIARGVSGRFNRARFQWEFPANEALFLQLARAVKAAGATVGKFSLPQGIDAEEAFNAIADLAIPNSLTKTEATHPDRRFFRTRYGVTFRHANQSVTVRLGNTSISLRVDPFCSDDNLQSRIIELAKRFSGQYNYRLSQLEFSPGDARFFEIARAMRPEAVNDVCQLWHPDEMNTDDFLSQLGFTR